MVYLSEKEELKKKVKQLETQLKQQQNTANRKISDNTKQYSRRSFLKAAGAGAVGLGAAAMIGNTSAFRINSNQELSYFNRSSNQSQFNVSPDGILDAKQIGTKKNPISSVHSQSINTTELSTNRMRVSNGHSRSISLTDGNRQQATMRPTVVVMYDDGYPDEYTDVFDIHKQYGLVGTTAMESTRLGSPDGLTVEQLTEMANWGWGVTTHKRMDGLEKHRTEGTHSVGDTRLTLVDGNVLSGRQWSDGSKIVEDYSYWIGTPQGREKIRVEDVDFSVSPPETILEDGLSNGYPDNTFIWMTRESYEREIGGSKQILLENGFGTNTYVPHGNGNGGAIGRSVISQYFDFARSIHDDGGVNTLPLNQYSLTSQPLSAADATYLDKIEATNGLGIIFGHNYNEISASLRQEIEDLLTNLQSRDIDVMTFGDAVERFGGASNYKRPSETGRAAWFPFIDDGTPTVRDAAGIHDGSWTQNPNYVTTALGTGASFNSNDGNHIEIPDSPELNPSDGNYSIAATFEIRGIDGGSYSISKVDQTTNAQVIVSVKTDGRIRAALDDGTGTTAITANFYFNEGDFVNVCFVRDADNNVLRLFTNASYDRHGPNETSFDGSKDVSPQAPLRLGVDYGGDESPFNLYDVQIFNRVIEREELVNWNEQTLPASYHENDVRSSGAGNGMVVTTPDGSAQYRIRVDNTGAITTEQI